MIEYRSSIAREGYPFIAAAGFATVVFALLDWDLTALLLLSCTLFCAYFFRDPQRYLPERPDALVAPADGKIIRIDREFDDRYLHSHVVRVSIFMSIFDVHVNRMITDCKVESLRYYPGKFYSANAARAGIENERCALLCQTPDQRRFAVVQVAGLIARRIICRARRSDMLQQGQRFGLIRFGSRVDLYLPQELQLEVTIGQRVRAGETILGYWGEAPAAAGESDHEQHTEQDQSAA